MHTWWEQFGLTRNPYDDAPLKEGGAISLEGAFVGRKQELDQLYSILSNKKAVAVCGGVGVGKTSLVHYCKFNLKNQNNPIFSSRKEIQVDEDLLNVRDFILEIIGSTVREIEIMDKSLIRRKSFLKRLNRLIDITQSISISGVELGVGGFGGGIGKETITTDPIKISKATLEGYLEQLIDFISKNKIGGKYYKGLIIQINNFDIVLPEKRKQVKKFLHDIRDLLQTPNLYFVFIGPSDFYATAIQGEQRVEGVFYRSPLLLGPLSKQELKKALDKRLKLATSKDISSIIQPFEDGVSYSLYDLFDGDIRSILSSLVTIRASTKVVRTLSNEEAILLLSKEMWMKATNQIGAGSKDRLRALQEISAREKAITPTQLAKVLNKNTTANISNYFRKFRESGIIELKERKGNRKYYHLTKEYTPLKLSIIQRAEDDFHKKQKIIKEQQTLF